MKRFNALILWTLIFGIAGIAIFNVITLSKGEVRRSKEYRIEINRINEMVRNGADPESLNLRESRFTYVQKVSWISADSGNGELSPFFDGKGVPDAEEFTVRPVFSGDRLIGYLRFSYKMQDNGLRGLWIADALLLLALGGTIGMLFYVRRQIIEPFRQMEELPYALARGHVQTGLKEHESRFFGKFIWGLDLLRETLEAQKLTNIRLEKERQTLIASLSHEIKTPVAAIKLYAGALYGKLYKDEDKREATARTIEQQAERIEGLVADLIKTSSSSIQDIGVHSGEFYLSEWLGKVIRNHRERLELLKITFEVGDYEDKLLYGDPDRLLEIMDNLIENAIKYGDGGLITISFCEEDYRQLIAVENTGQPVPSSELPHVFSSFWRGSNAAGKPGNGLGLYISRQLLRQMGGDLFAEPMPQGGMAFVAVLRY